MHAHTHTQTLRLFVQSRLRINKMLSGFVSDRGRQWEQKYILSHALGLSPFLSLSCLSVQFLSLGRCRSIAQMGLTIHHIWTLIFHLLTTCFSIYSCCIKAAGPRRLKQTRTELQAYLSHTHTQTHRNIYGWSASNNHNSYIITWKHESISWALWDQYHFKWRHKIVYIYIYKNKIKLPGCSWYLVLKNKVYLLNLLILYLRPTEKEQEEKTNTNKKKKVKQNI